MNVFDPRVDAYIDKAEPFAQPILLYLRALVHDTCSEVVESVKWGFPHFSYRNQLMCNIAAFKQHASFGFWKEALLLDEDLLQLKQTETAMGSIGKIRSMQDLPKKALLVKWIRQAMLLNEEGSNLPRKKAPEKKALEIPEALTIALAKHPVAQQTFEQFSYSHKKEYVEWIAGAKTDATRNRRIDKTIEQLAEGKSFNWQYQRK